MPDKILANYEMVFLPTGMDDELSIPSVIVDMPEVQLEAKRITKNRTITVSAGIAVFVTLLGLIFANLGTDSSGSDADSKEITLTVRVSPKHATVDVNGEKISGNPRSMTLQSSDEFRSITARAQGYETISKDVKLYDSQEVVLELVRIRETEEGSADSRNSSRGIGEEADDGAGSPGEMDDSIVDDKNIATVATSKRKGAASRARPRASGKPASKPAAPASSSWPDEKSPASSAPKPSTRAPADSYAGPSVGGVPATSMGTLQVRVPNGATAPISVSVNNRRHGNAPTSIKVEPGLHEIVFTYQGNRIFRMVNVKAGQTKRITPDID